MGVCLSRFVSVSNHCEAIHQELAKQGFSETENPHFKVLKHEVSFTAVKIVDDAVVVVLKHNATIMTPSAFHKLNEFLKKAKYTPHAIHLTSDPDQVFIQTWLLGPQTFAVNLATGTARALLSDTKIFIANYAICIMPEGLIFQSVDETSPHALVPWSVPLGSSRIASWRDKDEGAVVWLFDKGYFKPLFRRGSGENTISLNEVVLKTNIAEYLAVLEPHKDRRDPPILIAELLQPTAPTEEIVTRRIEGKVEAVWWLKENSGNKVVVLQEDDDVFVLGLSADADEHKLKMYVR